MNEVHNKRCLRCEYLVRQTECAVPTGPTRNIANCNHYAGLLNGRQGLVSLPAAAERSWPLKEDLATHRASGVSASVRFKSDICPLSDFNEAYRTFHVSLRLLQQCVVSSPPTSSWHGPSSLAASDEIFLTLRRSPSVAAFP